MMKVAVAVVFVVVLFAGIIVYNERQSSNQNDLIYTGAKVSKTTQKTNPTSTMTQPALSIDKNVQYTAVVTTSKGAFTIEMNKGQTPITVNNFLTLAQKGFYNGTIFHRVIKGFMIQGGDPTGTGTGGPGYRFADEPFEGAYTRGTVAMANAGPDTNGSQFFIMHEDQQLPPNYTIFGHVIEGMETVDAIASGAVTMSSSGEQSKPVEPVSIMKIEVTPSVTGK